MTTTTATKEAPAPVQFAPTKKVQPASPEKLIEHQSGGCAPRRIFDLHANDGDLAEAVKDRDWWRLIAKRLSRDDVVFVFAHDGSWTAECWVDEPGPTHAVVTVARLTKRSPLDRSFEVISDDYLLYHDANNAYCIKHIPTGRLEVQGEQSKAAARMKWLAQQPRKGN